MNWKYFIIVGLSAAKIGKVMHCSMSEMNARVLLDSPKVGGVAEIPVQAVQLCMEINPKMQLLYQFTFHSICHLQLVHQSQ